MAEPVECLPFPSAINSLDWSSFPWLAQGVGEVYGADRSYNGAEPIPAAVGLKPCADAETFAKGEYLDVDLPPQEYNTNGLALCCYDVIEADGGLLFNGAADIDVVNPAPWTFSNSCATAPVNDVALGSVQSGLGTIPGRWGAFALPLGINFKVRWLPASNTGSAISVIDGTCTVQTLVATLNASNPVSPLLGPAGASAAFLVLFDPHTFGGTVVFDFIP